MSKKILTPLFLVDYFKEVKQELTKVTWPTRQQTMNKTILIVVVSLVVGVYIGGLDLIMTEITKLLIK